MRATLILLCATVLLLATALKSSAQEPSLAAKQLEDVDLEGDTVASLLSDLAFDYDIPIGLELRMNDDVRTETRLNFKSITLADLLNRIVAEHKGYSWEICDGVVNVFPKEGHRDPIVERLLSVKISKFSVKKSTLTSNVESTLLETPEFREVVDAYDLKTLGWCFSGFYFPQLGRTYTLEVSDTPVRSILNRIVKESPTARFWRISRDSREHTFSVNLVARQEDSPNPRRTDLKRT